MDAVLDLLLPGMEERVLLRLARHAWDDGSRCRPGMDLLIRETGRSDRTIQRALDHLIERGLVEVATTRRGGRAGAAEYRLHIPLKTPTVLTENPDGFDEKPRQNRPENPDKTVALVGQGVDQRVGQRVGGRAKRAGPPVAQSIDQQFIEATAAAWADRLGGEEDVRRRIGKAMNAAGFRGAADQRQYIEHWLEEDARKERANGTASGKRVRGRGRADSHAADPGLEERLGEFLGKGR